MPTIFSFAAPILLLFCAALPQVAYAGNSCKYAEIASLPVIMNGYSPTVEVTVNGKPVRFELSSGAYFNYMSKAKAAELGLTTRAMPAGLTWHGTGGAFTAEIARVQDFGLAGIQLHNMDFVVGGSDFGSGYLGANLLGVWDTEFDFAKGSVKLFKASGCNRVGLAYWGAGMSVGEARLLLGQSDQDHRALVEVIVNGHSLRALLSSASLTELGSRAAARVGIDINSPQVVATGLVNGIGSHKRQTWLARGVSVSIGGEQISNTPMRIIDDSQDNVDADMTLGVDFLMAHHVLVSQSQHKMFLTYNGGPVFSAGTEREVGKMQTRAENFGVPEKQTEPKTADDFAGRGSGRLTHGDTIGAIADFSEAIRLAPGRADVLGFRATAYVRGGHPELASKDIDAALAITPHDHRLMIRRAQIRFAQGDKSGALADTDAAAAAVANGSLDVRPIVVMYERLGMADRGLALLDPLLALHREDSNYPSLLNQRCWNRALANAELDRALTDCNTAIKKAGPSPAMLDSRALVQLRRKDFTAAIADDNAALDKMPKYASPLFIRGLARIASGDSAAGQADIAAARAIQPTIDQKYAPYGLVAPGTDPARPPKPDGGEDAQ
jgi:predicted aspartyl protease/tetratricopeptide (TPR) repeat protein